MFFHILPRHIMRSMLLPFICCVSGFIFIFFIANLQDDLGDMLKLNDPTQVMLYYLLLIPDKFTYIAPMSLLLATIYCFSSLNQNNEIIAMRSAGLSIFRLSIPIYIFALLMGLGLFFSSEYLEPYCRYKTFELNTKAESIGRNREFHAFSHTDDDGSTRKWAMSSDEDKKYRGIQLLEYNNQQKLVREIEAISGDFSPSLGWIFYDVTITDFAEGNRIESLVKKKEYPRQEIKDDPITLSHINELQGSPSISQINKELSKPQFLDRKRELYLETRKFSLFFSPFTCLIGVLLGIPMATNSQRQASSHSAAKAIGIMILFYAINSFFTGLGRSDVLSPLLAAGLTSTVFILWGIRSSLKE